LKILSAEFITSAAQGAEGIPADGIAHVAFAGRSNVGKSTLLNALAKRSLARTSAAPGKTRLANIFLLHLEGGPGGPGRWRVYFVDLPGYGYARGGADAAKELAAVAQAYYESARGMRATLLLIDSRHPGMASDLQAHRWLTAVAGPPQIVATKIDKLTRSARDKSLKELERMFGTTPLPVSAAGGEGLEELWKVIARVSREPHR
jgi:GTP-binding protein